MQGNVYKDYTNMNINYSQSASFADRDREYLLPHQSPTATWRQGDSIKLSLQYNTDELSELIKDETDKIHFVEVMTGAISNNILSSPILYTDTPDEDLDVFNMPFLYTDIDGEDTGAVTKYMTYVQFFDFRYHPVYTLELKGVQSKMNFKISASESKEKFKQGIYYYRTILTNTETDEQYTFSDYEDKYVFVR